MKQEGNFLAEMRDGRITQDKETGQALHLNASVAPTSAKSQMKHSRFGCGNSSPCCIRTSDLAAAAAIIIIGTRRKPKDAQRQTECILTHVLQRAGCGPRFPLNRTKTASGRTDEGERIILKRRGGAGTEGSPQLSSGFTQRATCPSNI